MHCLDSCEVIYTYNEDVLASIVRSCAQVSGQKSSLICILSADDPNTAGVSLHASTLET